MNQAARDRSYWERHAKGYDVSLRALNRQLPRLRELVAVAVQGRERVLEVAAGTGLVTTAIASSAKRVTATDYSDAMVSTLKERVREAGLGNVECAQADLFALPYAPASFDAVVAANVLHLVPDLAAALVALRTMLRAGGTLVLPTFCHDETLVSAVVSRVIALTKFPGHRRFTISSLHRSLTEAGLQLGQRETLSGLIPIGYVDGAFAAHAPFSSGSAGPAPGPVGEPS